MTLMITSSCCVEWDYSVLCVVDNELLFITLYIIPANILVSEIQLPWEYKWRANVVACNIFGYVAYNVPPHM